MLHQCKGQIDRARRPRAETTQAEKLLWAKLRSRQLNNVKFRRQHPLGPYVADFASTEAMLVIELDGGQHAETREQDEARSSHMKTLGYEVLRFWNHEVLTNLQGVPETVFAHLELPPPSPDRVGRPPRSTSP